MNIAEPSARFLPIRMSKQVYVNRHISLGLKREMSKNMTAVPFLLDGYWQETCFRQMNSFSSLTLI